eukprot:GHRR01036421.1.p1 GENE.GHRR01036421.1~~GHRR01036421.1.p1  ORF type:complete len:208 (-),score=74.55 GHRR01036421.1:282-905(-)
MHIDHCAEQQQQQQQQVVKRGGRCHYTHLPRLLKVPGAPAEQLTALNMDKTSLLEQVLTRYDSGSGSGQQQQWPTASRGRPSQQQQRVVQQHPVGIEVIGELQFAFIAFVCAQSLEGGFARACVAPQQINAVYMLHCTTNRPMHKTRFCTMLSTNWVTMCVPVLTSAWRQLSLESGCQESYRPSSGILEHNVSMSMCSSTCGKEFIV